MQNCLIHNLIKSKSAIENGTEVTLNLWSNLIGNSNHETNFLHTLLLTDTQVSKIHKTFANSSSANVKFPKTTTRRNSWWLNWSYATSNVSSRKRSIQKGVSLTGKLTPKLAEKAI